MYRHLEHRQQRWRGPDVSQFTWGTHGGYLLSSMQGFFACVSSTTPIGRMKGCSLSPLRKPLYSRHATVPHDDQIHFSSEESHTALWTSWVSLLASDCRRGQREGMHWLQQGWAGQMGSPGMVAADQKPKRPPKP